MTFDARDVDAFDAVIAAWDDRVRCQMTTRRGASCRRAAFWRINLHGCEHGLVCGQHLGTWERDAAETSTGRCAHCGRHFEHVTDAYMVTPL